MKTFAFKSALLALIAIAPVWFLGRYDNTDAGYSDNLNILKFREIRKMNGLDYLIIGNSYAYSAVDPEQFERLGLRAYNLGIANAGVKYYDVIIGDYLRLPAGKPKHILILVSPMIFSSLADNFQSYPIHRYLTAPLSNEQLFLKYHDLAAYIGLVRHSCLKGFGHLFGRRERAERTENYMGFVPSSGTFSPARLNTDQPLFASLSRDSFPSGRARELLALANGYKRSGIGIVFYETPANKLNDFFSRAYLADYEKAVALLESGGFPVIRYPKTLGRRYFRDCDHMNSEGARLFTAYLIRNLRSN